MEPLAIFFILTGLGLDVIGAILIVSTVFTFKLKWTSELKNLAKPTVESAIDALGHLKKNLPPILEGDRKKALEFRNTTLKDIQKIETPLKGYKELLEKEKISQSIAHTKKYSVIGLLVLITGFVMQTVGILL